MNREILRVAFLVLMVGLVNGVGWGQTAFTATYDLSGGGNDVASFAYNGSAITGATPANLLKVGISSASSTGNFRGTNWPTGATTGSNTFTGSVNLGRYIEVSIATVSGYELSFTTISFGVGRSGTGPRQWQWRGSADNYANPINNYTTLTAGLTNNNGVLTNTDDNSSWTGNILNVSSYSNLTGTTVFRLYGFNSEAAGGTGGLQGNITIQGTYIPVASCTPPTTQASAFTTNNITPTQMDIGWTGGNGANALVVARSGGAVNADPANAATYTANSVFGSGTQIGIGNYVVYKGAGTSETVTNLMSNTTYHYAIYEFDGSNGNECYRISDKLTGNATTLAIPPVITHTGTSPASIGIAQGSVNNTLYHIQVAVTGAPATLTQLVVATAGTWDNDDLVNFKLRYSVDDMLDAGDATLATVSGGLIGGVQSVSFTGFNQSIPVGTRHLWVTCEVAAGATVGNTVAAGADADSDFAYAENESFSGSTFAAPNEMTIAGTPEIQLEYPFNTPVSCGFSLPFGNVVTNSMSTLTFRIRNTGMADLVLTSLPLTVGGMHASQFSITTQPVGPIAPGAFSDVVVQFSPTSTGAKTASISISSNDGNENPCTVSLSGTGTLLPLHYRTKQSGLWSQAQTWEASEDAITWSDAAQTPGQDDLSVSIRNLHEVGIDADVTIDQLVVGVGSLLNLTAGTLTVSNGAGTDLLVQGILRNSTLSQFSLNAGAVIVVDNGGKYQHNPSVSGSMTPMTWNVGATCEILRASGMPGGTLNQAYHHFVWNSANHGAATINLVGNLKTINGDFWVQNTGTGALRLAGSSENILNVAGNVVINSGTTLDLGNGSANSTLNINGNLTLDGALVFMGGSSNNGFVNLKGNLLGNGSMTETTSGTECQLTFNGTSPQSASFGPVSNRVNVLINNAQGIALNSGLTLTSSAVLTLSSGRLTLNEFDLNMASSGTTITGGSAASYIQTNSTGILRRTVGISAVIFPVGNARYNPATLIRTAASAVFGVRVLDGVFENGLSGNTITNNVLNRTWDVTLVSGAVGSIALDVQWTAADEGETTGFTRNSCYLSHFTAGGWLQDAGGAAGGSNPYTRSRSGITSLSPFAVGSQAALPIELINFEVAATDKNTSLTWATATELNNDFFQIERSPDGRTFEAIGEVDGAGTSSETLQYAYTDEKPLSGWNYYRLKQVDFDGQFAYSPVRAVLMGKATANLDQLRLFPNPAENEIFIQSPANIQPGDLLEIFDQFGRLVLQREAVEALDTPLDLFTLPAGLYVARLQTGDGFATGTFLVKR
ncbi:MAG: choice-of-anchor D domain-containing protein [Saprospiraceae bacterium]